VSIGVEFTYHSGLKEWFDPVDSEEFTSREQESHYLFSTMGYEHIVYKRDVRALRKYDLCEECGYETGRCSHTFVEPTQAPGGA
jgi:hypothetical protein